MSERIPKVGDDYYDDGTVRKIEIVGEQYKDGGWEVLLNDECWYDCYWRGQMNCWQYWNPSDQLRVYDD